jgi:hypothetical protein
MQTSKKYAGRFVALCRLLDNESLPSKLFRAKVIVVFLALIKKMAFVLGNGSAVNAATKTRCLKSGDKHWKNLDLFGA